MGPCNASTVNCLFASLYPEIHLLLVIISHVCVSVLNCSKNHEWGQVATPARVKYVGNEKTLLTVSLMSFGVVEPSIEVVSALVTTVYTEQGFTNRIEKVS